VGRSRWRLRLSLVVAAALVLAPAALGATGPQDGSTTRSQELGSVRIYNIQYRSHTGAMRSAYVVLPRWYSPALNPKLKVVISPHGRGLDGRKNARLFGQLPARGSFLLISPDGQGRRLPGGYSWGSPGQIEDLARMPRFVQTALPWLRLDMKQVYAFGGSMGGQETLLLLARHPDLLAGAAAFDAVSDFALQYRSFKQLRCNKTCLRDLGEPLGRRLQLLARAELGGTPWNRPLAFAQRSPITYARAIAASCVPLQLWWSPADRVVVDQQKQSGKLFWKLRGLNKNAPIGGYVGFWIHSREMKASTKLPYALRQFGLLPPTAQVDTTDLHVVPAPRESCSRR
jgi:pimeloyl-ACP methyl ester carboxylesterase